MRFTTGNVVTYVKLSINGFPSNLAGKLPGYRRVLQGSSGHLLPKGTEVLVNNV